MEWRGTDIRDINLAPVKERFWRAVHYIVDHVHREPFSAMSDHWRPSAQRDVGKTARQAAGVQMVIAGLEPHFAEDEHLADVIDLNARREAWLERLNSPDESA